MLQHSSSLALVGALAIASACSSKSSNKKDETSEKSTRVSAWTEAQRIQIVSLIATESAKGLSGDQANSYANCVQAKIEEKMTFGEYIAANNDVLAEADYDFCLQEATSTQETNPGEDGSSAPNGTVAVGSGSGSGNTDGGESENTDPTNADETQPWTTAQKEEVIEAYGKDPFVKFTGADPRQAGECLLEKLMAITDYAGWKASAVEPLGNADFVECTQLR